MSRSIADIVEAEIASGRTALPVFDGTSRRIQRMFSEQALDVDALQHLIGEDPVLSAAVLRLANSSFFGGIEKVTDIQSAIVRLGTKQVANLAMMFGQKQGYKVSDAELSALVGTLWHHAVACAEGARWLAQRVRRSDLEGEAFMAGMLHDIGKLLVLRVLDQIKRSQPRFQPARPLVLQLMATMHGPHGDLLMENWSIPDTYRRVACHHHDEEFDSRDTLLTLVRLADQACNKLGIGLEPTPDCHLASSPEAHALRISEVTVAELEIHLEDAKRLAEES